ncbi:unnamed protein product [Brassicogethes aeneus]|uniref:Isoleucine--tRNA ligase, cytoplasmic n=1 Tax=Brassicogethes aeneus TaxID=1431903 RepID=A0A9P0BDX3_BRAAE|nr:unnamed protein product [Brassicogethes aeneus]
MEDSLNDKVIQRAPEKIDFPLEEAEILDYWKQVKAFERSLVQSKEKARFTFYDGPPFATGLPHYGHILAGTVKDVVTRFAHQSGYHVERRFGWDCHGLPVEFEIDQLLGIKSPKDVDKIGIKAYNNECRKIVTRYSKEWKDVVHRIGRWIDFDNDYKTMYSWYMETVWWTFKELYRKGLIYEGNKVMPYSTACGTPLSNFEASQNYRETQDAAVVVSLPLTDDRQGAALLIWTTTPWTLPSNLAACVNMHLIYARVKQVSTERVYIMLEERIGTVFEDDDYEVLEKFLGIDLEGLTYDPPFPYYKHLTHCFKILADDYVTNTTGTGVVHQAPYFGEDDYRVCLKNNIITANQGAVCPVDASGCFTTPVEDFLGLHVKDSDRHVVRYLRERGRVVKESRVNHSYPFCWRSDTPLIYRAVPSWFLNVEAIKDKLLDAVQSAEFVPDFVKKKRFTNWLRDARDWAISRNRYWGTPIPIWKNDDEIVCVGSIEELQSLTGEKISDLHRENIDDLTIPSSNPNGAPLRRIREVFDCWFESGCMPYAQNHYPFENKHTFKQKFPADFIAEGIDQTRGWFYTLLVISTALFGEVPYKNVIANGLVLASDGQKMSKRKKNYPDPMDIIESYGADALRLYLINSPVVRAENLKFKEDGVREVVKDVLLPWYNAFRFLLQNMEGYMLKNTRDFHYKDIDLTTDNKMDSWILSYTQSFLDYVYKEMTAYHLYNVVPKLTKFIEDLTNLYVRLNRKRFKGETSTIDCKNALKNLFGVLYALVLIMAPFTPFLSEYMYQKMKHFTTSPHDSVHFIMLPKLNENFIDKNIENAVDNLQVVLDLARAIREKKQIPNKHPLPEIIVLHRDQSFLQNITDLKEYILAELNIKNLVTSNDKSRFNIALRAKPNYKTLGDKLKSYLKVIAEGILNLTEAQLEILQQEGSVDVSGYNIELNDVILHYESTNDQQDKYLLNGSGECLVLLDVLMDDNLQDEGVAREVINRVQKLRKKAHLVPTDSIKVYYKAHGDIERITKDFAVLIEGTIKASFRDVTFKEDDDVVIMESEEKLKDYKMDLYITKKEAHIEFPNTKWANLELVDLQPKYTQSKRGMILLEVAGTPITMESLQKSILALFGVEHFALKTSTKDILSTGDISKVHKDTIFIIPEHLNPQLPKPTSKPFCEFFNFTEGPIKGTIITENPKGSPILEEHQYKPLIEMWLDMY